MPDRNETCCDAFRKCRASCASLLWLIGWYVSNSAIVAFHYLQVNPTVRVVQLHTSVDVGITVGFLFDVHNTYGSLWVFNTTERAGLSFVFWETQSHRAEAMAALPLRDIKTQLGMDCIESMDPIVKTCALREVAESVEFRRFESQIPV